MARLALPLPPTSNSVSPGNEKFYTYVFNLFHDIIISEPMYCHSLDSMERPILEYGYC